MPHLTRPGPRWPIARSAFIVSVPIAMLAAPSVAASQPPQQVFRVGHLSAGGRAPDGDPPRPLREGLRGLGYVEGQNVAFEAGFADGKVDRLPGLAAELLRLKSDVIVAQGGPATVAAKHATSTILIVMAPAAGDAVAAGLVASLARSGGNVTGLSDESIHLGEKKIEADRIRRTS